MRRMLRCLAPVALVAAFVSVAAACSKPSADPNKPLPVRSLGGRIEPRPVTAPQPAPTAASDEDPQPRAEVQPHAIIGNNADAAPLTYEVKTRVDSGPKEDPDLAVVETGRRAASSCFTGISDGSESRTASILVHVLPSGSVSRSEVSAETTQEPWVLSCLENVGPGLHFADKPNADIRTFSISVSVSRSH